jgi:hypothetical protein
MKQKRIRENPVLAIERKSEDEPPIFQYTLAQEAQLVEQLNEEEVDCSASPTLTGLRQGNQFSLRKTQINLSLGIIAIPRTKNRKPRIAHRRQMARHLGIAVALFWDAAKNRHLNARWWYKKRFKSACERDGSK